jgi:hypothetical protein
MYQLRPDGMRVVPDNGAVHVIRAFSPHGALHIAVDVDKVTP